MNFSYTIADLKSKPHFNRISKRLLRIKILSRDIFESKDFRSSRLICRFAVPTNCTSGFNWKTKTNPTSRSMNSSMTRSFPDNSCFPAHQCQY
jgi:hypothetical protein